MTSDGVRNKNKLATTSQETPITWYLGLRFTMCTHRRIEGVPGNFSQSTRWNALLTANGKSQRIAIRGGGVIRGFEFKGQTTTKQSASRLAVVVWQNKRTRVVWGSTVENVWCECQGSCVELTFVCTKWMKKMFLAFFLRKFSLLVQ